MFVKLEGTVVYVEDVHSVWFTPAALQDPLDELMENLAKVGATLKPAANLNSGEIYATIYSEDGEYYRCSVLEENQGKVQVLFVDYGNQESKSRTDILELTPDLKRLQGTAFKVIVYDTQDIPNTPGNMSTLEETILNVPVQISMEVVNETKVAKIYIDGKKLDLKFPDMQPVTPTPETLPLNEKVAGSIVYIEDMETVWFTPSSIQDELDTLMEHLATVGASLKPAANLNPGDIYATIYSEDGGYYRCSVLEENQGKVQVLFVDYGNQESKSRTDILELTPDLKSLRAAATKVKIPYTEKIPNTGANLAVLEDTLLNVPIEIMIQGSPAGKTGKIFINGTSLQLEFPVPEKISKPVNTSPSGESLVREFRTVCYEYFTLQFFSSIFFIFV